MFSMTTLARTGVIQRNNNAKAAAVTCQLPEPTLSFLGKLAVAGASVGILLAIVATPVTMLTSHLATTTTSLLQTVSPHVSAPTEVTRIGRHTVFLAGGGRGAASHGSASSSGSW